MWYFSWILGVGLACTFGILNAMWFEMREDRRSLDEGLRSQGPPPRRATAVSVPDLTDPSAGSAGADSAGFPRP